MNTHKPEGSPLALGAIFASTFLELMGARIRGKGTSMVSVDGGVELHGCDYTFVEDFHEVATFLALAALLPPLR